MLHKDKFIIAPETFSLIQQLQALPELKDFYLVGGTALALQLGHRNSIDIDLFTNKGFETELLLENLRKKYEVEVTHNFRNTILATINHIKTDFISHQYPIIKPIITEENISMLSLEDICAMKLNAISNSGQRLKDFIDIYYLLEHFSFHQMISFYKEKYPNFNPVIPCRAITFFDDIDQNIDHPKMIKPIKLTQIKKRLTDAVLHSTKIFKS